MQSQRHMIEHLMPKNVVTFVKWFQARCHSIKSIKYYHLGKFCPDRLLLVTLTHVSTESIELYRLYLTFVSCMFQGDRGSVGLPGAPGKGGPPGKMGLPGVVSNISTARNVSSDFQAPREGLKKRGAAKFKLLYLEIE